MNLNTILAILGPLLLVTAAVAYYRTIRSTKLSESAERTANQAAQTVSVLQLEMEAYKERADRLDEEVRTRDAVISTQLSQIEKLKERTDLQPVMERLARVAEDTSARHTVFAQNTEAISKMVIGLAKESQALTKKIDTHEKRAQERHESTVAALERLASNLAA